MKNKEIADIFKRMAALLEIKEENFFKIRAYHTAADNIMALSESLEDLRDQGRLSEVSGIGKTLQEKIGEYLDTGKMQAYDKLLKDIPESILEVVSVPSVGPKKAKLFFDELNVRTVDDLERALESGKVSELPGIKEKTVDNIRQGIKFVKG